MKDKIIKEDTQTIILSHSGPNLSGTTLLWKDDMKEPNITGSDEYSKIVV